MKPAPFSYARPASLDEAAALVAENGAVAMAGGQSLGPMLNLRLAQPRLVVDLTAIAELTRAEADADALEIGACVTTADVEDGRVADVARGMLAHVARGIAYRAVRNRGTVGGSLAHADPAGDWLSALIALGAEAVIHGAAGARRMPLAGFVSGAFATALRPGELLAAVRIPRLGPAARWGYYKVCRRTGEFADAIGAVVRDPERGLARAVIGATGGAPIDVSGALGAGGLDREAASRALEAAGVGDPIARRRHVVALARATERALAA